jgi:carbon-monoxide dehydrogenase large subunit
LGGLENFRARQRAARAEGRYLGLGVGCYTEGTAVGPFESARVRVDPSGAIAVATGACDQGQGHRTAFAQVAADAWQVPLEQISITVGDTAGIAMGYGTVASRSGVTSSTAIAIASERLKQKVIRIAANMLETPEEDLEFRDGGVGVKGVPAMQVSLAEVEKAARPDWEHRRPPGMEPGLEETYLYEPPTVTWAYATDAAIVEIDPATGVVRVEKLVAVHDSGRLINPAIAEGQIRGGLAQGFGAALLEELVYDAEGQLLTGSFADYLMPTAPDMPPIAVLHPETPTPLNPLGVKGLGEGGAIAPPAVIANAVCDALRPFKAEFNRLPIRWEQVAAVFGDDPFEPATPP